MKNLLLKLSFAILLVFASCSDDNPIIEEQAETSSELNSNLATYAESAAYTNQEQSVLNTPPCLQIVMPYTVTNTNGTDTAVINTFTDLQDFINNLEPNEWYTFNFPIDTEDANGNIQTVNNIDELIALMDACGAQQTNPFICFSLDYPVTVVTDEEVELTVNNDQELLGIPEINGFVYPISVTEDDGTNLTLNSSQEFDDLYNSCLGIQPCTNCDASTACFEMIFPFDFVLDNGTIVQVNSDIELNDFFVNLPTDSNFSISYPVTVELEDGTQQIINNDQELNDLLVSCL